MKAKNKNGMKKKPVKKDGMKKGDKSKTHKGDLDFTTKRGDKDYHRGGKDVKPKKGKAPFKKKK